MKAVILAAGKGTRMRELTKDVPKPLIPINGIPFLQYVISNLRKCGIDNFGIVVNYKKEKIEEWVKEKGINATIIDQKEPLGTGHAVLVCEEYVGNQDFLVLMGDNYYSVQDIKEVMKDDGFCYLSGLKHNHPERYGVLQADDWGNLIKIIEKPKEYVGNLINIALYKFKPEIFDALKKIEKSPRGEYELPDAINTLAAARKVKVVQMKEDWLDFGCPEDIPKVSDFFYKNELIGE